MVDVAPAQPSVLYDVLGFAEGTRACGRQVGRAALVSCSKDEVGSSTVGMAERPDAEGDRDKRRKRHRGEVSDRTSARRCPPQPPEMNSAWPESQIAPMHQSRTRNPGLHGPVHETQPDQHEDQTDIAQEVLIEGASRRHARGTAMLPCSGEESMKMPFPARPAPRMAASTGIVPEHRALPRDCFT